MKIYKTLKDKIQRRSSIVRERMLGLDLTKSVDSKSLGLAHHEGDVFYASSLKKDMIEVLDTLNINNTHKVLDFGAGKGAAMLVLDEYDFAEVAGVEISSDLCRIADKNFEILKKNHLKVYESDATIYTDIDSYTHFYFFHPFSPEITQIVLDNIHTSVSLNPRQVTLIYYNPGYRDIFAARQELKLINSFEGWKYNTLIYTYE